MYSLGLIFFEMWVGGFATFGEMDKTFSLLRRENKIAKEYESKIPPDAAKLILWLVKEDPAQRPSTTSLL